jgi:uncharacterized protein YbjT (DUF2867 family)
MYAITGASGNTGSVIARTLLDHGKQVRVIGRNADHLRQFTSRGAEAVIAEITDTAKLARAFTGAEAVYAMIPPNVAAPDVYAYDDAVINSLAEAIAQAHVRHAVVLSSFGADKNSGTGLVLALYRLEQALLRIPNLNTLSLRAGYFMENTLSQVGAIHSTGNLAGPLHANLKLPLIATRDIGQAAAQALLELSFTGHQTRELHGQRDIGYSEIALVIGRAIDKPNLKYQQFSDAQLTPMLMQAGMSHDFVRLLLEMSTAINSGHMRALEERTQQNSTPTMFESFVEEKFVPVFRQTTKAA